MGTLPKSWRFRSKSRPKDKKVENDKRSRSKSRGRHLRDFIKNKIAPTKDKYTIGAPKSEMIYKNDAFVDSLTDIQPAQISPIKMSPSAYNFNEKIIEPEHIEPRKSSIYSPEIIEPRKPSIYSVYENEENSEKQNDSVYSEEPTSTFLTQEYSSGDDEYDESCVVEICEVFDPPEGFRDNSLVRWSSKSSLELVSPLETDNR